MVLIFSKQPVNDEKLPSSKLEQYLLHHLLFEAVGIVNESYQIDKQFNNLFENESLLKLGFPENSCNESVLVHIV